MSPESRAVNSSYQRRAMAAVSRLRARPLSAGNVRAAASVIPSAGIRCRDEPVEQDRLLKSDIIVIVRGEPVAAREHLAASFGVKRFIRVPDCRASEAGEIGHPAEKHEEQSRPAHRPEFYLSLCRPRPLARSTPETHTCPLLRSSVRRSIGGSSATVPSARSSSRGITCPRQPARDRGRRSGRGGVARGYSRADRHHHRCTCHQRSASDSWMRWRRPVRRRCGSILAPRAMHSWRRRGQSASNPSRPAASWASACHRISSRGFTQTRSRKP